MEDARELNKQGCFIPLKGYDCPETCAGVLATKFLDDPYGGEGFMIQVCPNPDKQGQPNGEANYCGLGADVITIYRNTVPTDEEFAEAAHRFEG